MFGKKYFEGKVFIVTGASSGIGKSIAIEAAKQGANVSVASRNIEKLNIVAEEIRKFNVQSLAVKTDVSKKEDAENLILKTVERFGKIDVLVNNAGISMRAMFSDLDVEVFDKVMDVNFRGTVYCSKYALTHILKQKGSIVGVSSISGFSPLPARTAYCSSKYAMFGFLTTLRLENLKKGLHVLITHPGFTESEIRMHALTADGSEQGKTPRHENKMMSSAEVAKHVLRAIKKRKKVQILTLTGKATFFFEKFIPNIANKLIYKMISKEPNSPVPKL